MGKNDIVQKRRGGSALLIIFLIVVLSLLFFIFIMKKIDIHLIYRTSSEIESMKYGTKSSSSGSRNTFVSTSADPRHVSVVYVTTEDKISSCFIQVINAYESKIYYIEVPLNSKFSIGAELYRQLQLYAPTLPQNVKLSRAYSYFSENIRYTACTDILSEYLDMNFTDWSVMTDTFFDEFRTKTSADGDILSIYSTYADTCRSSLLSDVLWEYYELYSEAEIIDKGTIPGQWDKTDFYITAASAREIIEELKY